MESAVVIIDKNYVHKTDLSPAEFKTVYSDRISTQTAVLRRDAYIE